MAEPSVEVLGVYRVRATDELIQDRMQYSHPPPNERTKELHLALERECREYLESIVLIELLVHNRDDRFDVGDFTQRVGGATRDDWQVACAEAFLTPDGEALASARPYDVPPGDLRVAFFLHDWDGTRRLATSYGDIDCPAPTTMPERLVPYENVN